MAKTGQNPGKMPWTVPKLVKTGQKSGQKMAIFAIFCDNFKGAGWAFPAEVPTDTSARNPHLGPLEMTRKSVNLLNLLFKRFATILETPETRKTRFYDILTPSGLMFGSTGLKMAI